MFYYNSLAMNAIHKVHSHSFTLVTAQVQMMILQHSALDVERLWGQALVALVVGLGSLDVIVDIGGVEHLVAHEVRGGAGCDKGNGHDGDDFGLLHGVLEEAAEAVHDAELVRHCWGVVRVGVGKWRVGKAACNHRVKEFVRYVT